MGQKPEDYGFRVAKSQPKPRRAAVSRTPKISVSYRFHGYAGHGPHGETTEIFVVRHPINSTNELHAEQEAMNAAANWMHENPPELSHESTATVTRIAKMGKDVQRRTVIGYTAKYNDNLNNLRAPLLVWEVDRHSLGGHRQ